MSSPQGEPLPAPSNEGGRLRSKHSCLRDFGYSYRKDGLLQNQTVNWSASGNPSFSWIYTPGGRELTQSDPLTGTKVPELTNGVQLGGATWSYEPKNYTYDGFGRPSTLALPEGYTEGSRANPITYDRDDEVTGFNQYNNGFCTASCQQFQANGIARQFLLNTRGEMLEDNIPAIPNSGIFQQSANGYLEYGVEWDTRSNMMYSEPYWFPVQGQGPQYGSQNFIYDAAGRQATGWYSYNQLLPPPVQTPPNGALYVYTRSYDAENHVVNAPAPSSIDANANDTCGYQCAPNAIFTWGPDGHLRDISGAGLHYDGDTILFGSTSQGPILHLGTMGTLTAAGTFSIMDRDSSGTQQAVHGATWFAPWNLGPAIPRFGKSTVNITLAPGSCAPDQNGQNGNVQTTGHQAEGTLHKRVPTAIRTARTLSREFVSLIATARNGYHRTRMLATFAIRCRKSRLCGLAIIHFRIRTRVAITYSTTVAVASRNNLRRQPNLLIEVSSKKCQR